MKEERAERAMGGRQAGFEGECVQEIPQCILETPSSLWRVSQLSANQVGFSQRGIQREGAIDLPNRAFAIQGSGLEAKQLRHVCLAEHRVREREVAVQRNGTLQVVDRRIESRRRYRLVMKDAATKIGLVRRRTVGRQPIEGECLGAGQLDTQRL